ncbi:hypothetical protein J6590_011119 [Homalodisca vitripennis]|nr:hypothetical protein J6590_011119 [Homalodisca vitripennis]
MEGEVRAKKPSLTLMLGTNGLKALPNHHPPARQAGCLQGQDRSAVTHPSSSHARRCLIWLSHDNRHTHFTTPLANNKLVGKTLIMEEPGSNRKVSVRARDFANRVTEMLASDISDDDSEESDFFDDSDADPDWREPESEVRNPSCSSHYSSTSEDDENSVGEDEDRQLEGELMILQII